MLLTELQRFMHGSVRIHACCLKSRELLPMEFSAKAWLLNEQTVPPQSVNEMMSSPCLQSTILPLGPCATVEGEEETSTTMSISKQVDEADFALLSDEDGASPMSDEKYAELFFRFFLLPQSSSYEMGISGNQVKMVEAEKLCFTETGEFLSTLNQICDICMETKSEEEFFRNPDCSHRFCSDCISKYIALKIQDNITIIRCPGASCVSLLEPELCGSVLPNEVFKRWVDSLSAVLGSKKFYCPFKDCSAILVDENFDGGKIIRKSECPHCNRLLCVKCKVPWHSYFECQEFQEFQEFNEDDRNRDDFLFMKLVNRKNWKTCQRCHYFVEKTDGCLHITCRCGFEFCYSCGEGWSSTHICSRN